MSLDELDKASSDEQKLRELAKASLERSVDNIDGATLSRLRQARHAAMQQRETPVLATWLRPALASAFTVCALAILLTMLPNRKADDDLLANAEALQQMDDFQLLSNGEDLDMIQDLEFYEWLEQQDQQGGLG